MQRLLIRWDSIAKSIDSNRCSKEVAKELCAISRSLAKTARNWNLERNYSNYILKMCERIKRLFGSLACR